MQCDQTTGNGKTISIPELQALDKFRKAFSGQVTVKEVDAFFNTVRMLHGALVVAASYMPTEKEVTAEHYAGNHEMILAEVRRVQEALKAMDATA